MNEKPAKPADEDPDATVTSISRADLMRAPDDDATVMMSRKALEEPGGKGGADDDATVMMSRSALTEPEPDPDATVTISAASLKGPSAEEAAAETAAAVGAPTVPPAALTGEAAAPRPLDIAQNPSRMPMIAGAAVVVLVVAYYIFSGS